MRGGSLPEPTLKKFWLRRCKSAGLKRAFTIDVLGEAVASEIEADRWQRAYLDLIEQSWPDGECLAGNSANRSRPSWPLPRVNVSIKLSALDSQFDPIDPEGSLQRMAARLRPILRAARQQHAHVHVDMESYRIKDLTLHVSKMCWWKTNSAISPTWELSFNVI